MKDEIIALLDKVQSMRQAQNAYFKFKGDPDHKKGILIRSKQLEIEVDQDAARLKGLMSDPNTLQMNERARVIGVLTSLSYTADDASNELIDALIKELMAYRREVTV